MKTPLLNGDRFLRFTVAHHCRSFLKLITVAHYSSNPFPSLVIFIRRAPVNCSIRMLLALVSIVALSIASADANYIDNARVREVKSRYYAQGITPHNFQHAHYGKLQHRSKHHGHRPIANFCGLATAATFNSTDGTIPAGIYYRLLFDGRSR
jgi:predicted nucleic acid-binding protein